MATTPMLRALLPAAALLLILLSAPADATKPKCLKRRLPLDAAFCASPPVIRRLDLSAYQGRWYQTFTTGFAGSFGSNRCVTANYTLQADSTVAVLNCQQRAAGQRPVCVRAVAARRFPGDRRATARLGVSFFPGAPPGQYNVAAIIGSPSYGYAAAAVFSCNNGPQGARAPGFFIIARSPWAPTFVLNRLRRRLRCAGYRVPFKMFEQSAHPHSCLYQAAEGSFDVEPPQIPPQFARPPQ